MIGMANLTSPFYPEQFPSVPCTWYVSSPGNSTIILTFKDFHIETRYDYLYLGHGDVYTEESKILTLTGAMAPKTFQVDIAGMWIHLQSDPGLLTSRGFYVTLKATEKAGK